MSKAAQITFKDFRTRFATEDACRDYLFQERFPEGFVCPKCGCREHYYLKTRRSCQCKRCRRQTSVTAGTVMHRTHLPLTVWFWAIYLCATDKRGISAKGLARQLEISYESAWYLLVRMTRITCWKELSRWMKRIWVLQNAEGSVVVVPSARKWRLRFQRTKKIGLCFCSSR